LRYFTVTYHGHAFAVVRAADEAEAIALACEMIVPKAAFHPLPGLEEFAAHEPSNGELSDWLGHRSDYLLTDGTSYILSSLLG
jgi:hypothetical protein